MKFSKKFDNPVFCLCWKCGKEIRLHDRKCFINEEIWCEDCAGEVIAPYEQ